MALQCKDCLRALRIEELAERKAAAAPGWGLPRCHDTGLSMRLSAEIWSRCYQTIRRHHFRSGRLIIFRCRCGSSSTDWSQFLTEREHSPGVDSEMFAGDSRAVTCYQPKLSEADISL